MAFTAGTLSLVAQGTGCKIYIYKTADAAADVDTAGYFNDVANVLNLGDIIFRLTFSSTAFTTLSNAGMHVVASNTGTVVDVFDQLPIANLAIGASVLDTD
jgi:hypothetical protein